MAKSELTAKELVVNKGDIVVKTARR